MKRNCFVFTWINFSHSVLVTGWHLAKSQDKKAAVGNIGSSHSMTSDLTSAKYYL